MLSLSILIVLNHSNKIFKLNLFSKESFNDGSDKVISILFEYLKKQKQIYNLNNKQLPPKLILQVDNCLKENKESCNVWLY